MKRLPQPAYDALYGALCSFWYYKSTFEKWLRRALHDHPELCAGIDFADNRKRDTVDTIIDRLRHDERKYFDITLDVLVQLSTFDNKFSELAQVEKQRSKEGLVETARSALGEVKRLTSQYKIEIEERESARREAEASRERAAKESKQKQKLAGLLERYQTLYASTENHRRGIQLEKLLNDLFLLWGLEAHPAYNLEHEQIDGAFTFDTDDYLLEAKWWQTSLQDVDVAPFKNKVSRKHKNTLGLYVSINGFTDGAVKLNSNSTSLVFADGQDLYYVLEQRISLTDALRAKRQHAARTGSPFLSVVDILA